MASAPPSISPGLQRLLGIARLTHDRPIELATHATRIRQGKDVRMIVGDDQDRSADTIDKPPVTLIAEALGKCRKRSAQLLKVAMLAPDIIARCIAGTQPVSLTTKLLLNMELPIRWKQRRIPLGIGCVQIPKR